MERTEFALESMADSMKWSEEYLSEIKMKAGVESEDFLKQLLTVRIKAYFYSHETDEKEITCYSERPTFLDWLLRRTRTHVVNVKVKDILKNPPKGIKTKRLYFFEEVN